MTGQPEPRPMPTGPGALRDAPVALADLLDTPPALLHGTLRGGARLTRRWTHGGFHGALPAMESHVVVTYYGAAQNTLWRHGARRMASRTRPGAISLIPAGADGRGDLDGAVEVSHVYIPDGRLKAVADSLARGAGTDLAARLCVDDPVTGRLLEILGIEADHRDPTSSLFVEQAVDLLCTQLLRAHSTAQIRAQPEIRRGLVDWQVRRVTTYMMDFLDDEIRLDDLAAQVNLSRFHFCRAFRLATGQTPHQWLMGLRLTRARLLLADPVLSVTAVALAVGFQTPGAFSQSFRRFAGMTPTEFRRRL